MSAALKPQKTFIIEKKTLFKIKILTKNKGKNTVLMWTPAHLRIGGNE